MKIRQKGVLVKSAAMFEVYDELQMLKSRQESPAVVAERNVIREQLILYKLELVQAAQELQREMNWEEFGDSLINYATRGERGGEVERRERWIRRVALPVVAAVVAVADYFADMD